MRQEWALQRVDVRAVVGGVCVGRACGSEWSRASAGSLVCCSQAPSPGPASPVVLISWSVAYRVLVLAFNKSSSRAERYRRLCRNLCCTMPTQLHAGSCWGSAALPPLLRCEREGGGDLAGGHVRACTRRLPRLPLEEEPGSAIAIAAQPFSGRSRAGPDASFDRSRARPDRRAPSPS